MDSSPTSNADTAAAPRLPTAYEPIFLDAVDSVLAEGIRRARAGAGEGTVIWARTQSAARTRRGHAWQAPRGNLHCAILMRPDYPNARAQQLCLVAALAAGAAIAEVLAPMTGLTFAWPGDIMINELQAGRIDIAAGEPASDPWDWLVIALSVNVAHHPPNPEPERFNSIHASAEAETDLVDDAHLLEYYARHFLRWVNIWAEDGFQSIARAWAPRAHNMADAARMQDLCPRSENASVELGDTGELLVHDAHQAPRRLHPADYYGLGARHSQSPAVQPGDSTC